MVVQFSVVSWGEREGGRNEGRDGGEMRGGMGEK